MLVAIGEVEEMLVSTGPIALARPGWGLKGNTITSVVSNGAEGHPEVLCAQILLGAAASGLRVLALLPGMRDDEPTWAAIGDMLGGDGKAAARELRQMRLVMYSSGTGREYASKAELVYAPGLQPGELERLINDTTAPVLTLTDLDSEVTLKRSGEVIRVGGGVIALDSEGFEVPVVFDPSGPVYRPA